MPARGQVDADPDGVVEGLQRKRPRLPGRVEEPGEGRAVEQRHPVREHGRHITGMPRLPLPGIEFADEGLLPGPLQRRTQRAERTRGAVQQLP